MSVGKKITLRELESFISEKLKKKLQGDLRKLRIVKEADLECCTYYHLRRFVQRDNRWKVLARKHARRIGRYIDLLIFRKTIPRIAIELKWNRKLISKKDRKSLRASLRKLRVNKAYFIVTTIPDSSDYKKLVKNPREKYYLHEIVVSLDLPLNKYEDWKAERRKYTREMSRRKIHH